MTAEKDEERDAAQDTGPEPRPGTHPKKGRTAHGLVVAALGIVLYLNTLNHGYVLDDTSVITQNWLTRSGIKGIPTILTTSYRHGHWTSLDTLYRPLSLVLFAVEWELFPNRPAAGHIVNVLLYGLLGLILFRVLRRLMAGWSVAVPFAAALLFMAHPIHTEVVANIKSRDEILCLLFTLLAFDRLWKFLESRSMTALGTALLCYFLALLSKESALTILVVIPLALHFFTDLPTGRKLRLAGLFAAPALLYIGIRLLVLGSLAGPAPAEVMENSLVGADGFPGRCATAFLVLGKYLLLLFFPHPLVCDYSYDQIPITGFGDLRVILSLLAYAALLFAAVRWFRRRNVAVFGILFFLATISVYSNVVFLIGSQMGERFLFTPSLGFCLAAAYVLSRLLRARSDPGPEGETLPKTLRRHRTLFVAVGLLLAACAVKTFVRNGDWKSQYDLYSTDVRKSPRSARLHHLYGQEILNSRAAGATDLGRRRKYLLLSIDELRRATEIYEPYVDAYAVLGVAWSRLGERGKAMEAYLKALQFDSSRAPVYNNLGALYFEEGNFQEALRLFLEAVRFDPRYSRGHRNVGDTFVRLGRLDEAIAAYLTCLKYDPRNVEVYRQLGAAYERKGDRDNARLWYERARALGAPPRR